MHGGSMARRMDDIDRTPREIRRHKEAIIHAVLRGSDTWQFGVMEWLCILGIIVIVVLASGTVRGDTIVQVDYYNETVQSESYGLVAEVGAGLAGKGRPMGWIYMWQPETFWGVGPGFEFGGYAERYGGTTQQTLRFFGDEDGYLKTGVYGERITGSSELMVSSGYVRPNLQIPIGQSAVYVPFVWWSHADQFGDDNPDTMFQGSGWISLTMLNQQPPAGELASFTVEEVLLATAESFAGQRVFSAAVPEPSIFGAVLLLLLTAVCVRSRRRSCAASARDVG